MTRNYARDPNGRFADVPGRGNDAPSLGSVLGSHYGKDATKSGIPALRHKRDSQGRIEIADLERDPDAQIRSVHVGAGGLPISATLEGAHPAIGNVIEGGPGYGTYTTVKIVDQRQIDANRAARRGRFA